MRAIAIASDEPGSVVQVLDRNALFSALARAVEPTSPHSVLVVLGFEGLNEYLESEIVGVGLNLLGQVGARLTKVVGESGSVFESRRGEFCTLLEGGLDEVRPLLTVIPCELDDVTRVFGVRSSLGIALLPDEATFPTYALALADRRLRALSGNLRHQHH